MALEQVLKPSLLNFGPANLHMVKMGISGMDPIVTILGVFSMVGFNLPNVWSTFSWYQKLLYHCRYKIFPKLYQFTFIRKSLSWILLVLLRINLTRFTWRSNTLTKRRKQQLSKNNKFWTRGMIKSYFLEFVVVIVICCLFWK